MVLVFAIFFMDWGDMPGLDGETPPFEGVSSLFLLSCRRGFGPVNELMGGNRFENGVVRRLDRFGV